MAGCVQKTCFHREQNNQCSEEADSNGPSESDEMFLRRLLFQYMEAGGGDGLLDWGEKKFYDNTHIYNRPGGQEIPILLSFLFLIPLSLSILVFLLFLRRWVSRHAFVK